MLPAVSIACWELAVQALRGMVGFKQEDGPYAQTSCGRTFRAMLNRLCGLW